MRENNPMFNHRDKLGQTRMFSYTPQGLLQTVTDGTGVVAVTNTHDDNCRLASTAGGLGDEKLFQWDSEKEEWIEEEGTS